MKVTLSLADIVQEDPELLHGTPVFKGTRVPVRALVNHLEAGDSLEVFLEDFPAVAKEQAVAFIGLASDAALAQRGARSSR